MNILDYLTMAALADKKTPMGLENFARDPKADVYSAERNSVVVICESEKISQKIPEKYAMSVVDDIRKVFLKGAETKEELVGDYAKLMAMGVIQSNCISSCFVENLRKGLEGLQEEQSKNM